MMAFDVEAADESELLEAVGRPLIRRGLSSPPLVLRTLSLAKLALSVWSAVWPSALRP